MFEIIAGLTVDLDGKFSEITSSFIGSSEIGEDEDVYVFSD